jgi:Lysine-specific metallo-endopeptidase
MARLGRKRVSPCPATARQPVRGRTLRSRPAGLGNQALLRQMPPGPATGPAAWTAAPAAAMPTTRFADCTAAQLPGLRTAVTRAGTDLAAAIAALDQRPLTQAAADALWLAFRGNDEATAQDVSAKLGKIKSGLPCVNVECEQPDSFAYDTFCADAGAYVRAAAALVGTGSIHVCMGFWDGAGEAYRSRTLIHEGAHRFFNAGDKGYFADCVESSQTDGLTSAQRRDNADSYACVVTYLARLSPAELRLRVRGLHGETIRGIVQDPAGAVALADPEVARPSFVLAARAGDSLPASAQYRWVIADVQDRRYLMWGDQGGVFEFGAGNTKAHISAKTRELLRQRGIREAKVLCRVRIVGGGEFLHELTVRFTF